MLHRIVNKLTRYINRKSAYPLLLANWQKAGTPSLIGEAFNTAFFRKNMRPEKVDLSQFSRIMVLAPHQDDEAIGCGGILALTKDHAEIELVFVTDGMSSRLQTSERDIVKTRRKEAESAAQVIGAHAIHLEMPNEEDFVNDSNAEILRRVIEDFKPDLLLAPWLFDRPVKHRMVNELVFRAMKNSTLPNSLPIWGYQVHNIPFFNVVVDFTSVVEYKRKMISCHTSQIEEVAPYDHFILGMNQWNAQFNQGNTRGYTELFFAVPLKEWCEFFETLLSERLDEYYSF